MPAHRAFTSIDTIIIHHSATPNGETLTALDINELHKKCGYRRDPSILQYHAAQLRHIGYHFVIRVDGCVEACRKAIEVGQHADGHEATSLAVCVVGTDKFTDDQWLMLRKNVESLKRTYPSIKFVRGHNDVADSTCPGFSVPEWLAGGMQPLPAHVLPLAEE